MAGKHEPDSKGSFYLSLTTATLRAGLVIGAVALGIFVLSKAFESAGTQGQPQAPLPASPATSPATTPTESPPAEQSSPSPTESPEVAGVLIQVQNGTTTTGLAAETGDQLSALGYVVDAVGNAPRTYEQSTIFFRPNSKLEAEHLNQTFFGGTALLERIQGDTNPDIRMVVVVGLDFSEQAPAEEGA